MNQSAFIAVLLVFASPVTGQVCGDCNGDGAVDVLDALRAVQHAVLIELLGPAGFVRCNVAATPGGPSTPGAAVDVLDGLLLAQASVGIGGPLVCATGVVVSAGPYDLDFLAAPAYSVSDKRFEVSIGLFDQATGRPAQPATPVLVTLSLDSGLGPLSGSVRQWMRTESMVFGNLIVGEVGIFTLRAQGGALDHDMVSRSIENLIAVESDVRGETEGATPPYNPTRFYLRNHGVNTPVPTGFFSWETIQVSTGTSIATGSIALTGQTFIDAPFPTVPALGMYRVKGWIEGTISGDSHGRYLRLSNGGNYSCSLPSARVGQPYSADLRQIVGTAFVSFHLLADQLPPGLSSIPSARGVVSGTPTRPGHYLLVGFGIDSANRAMHVAFSISVFSWRDTEIEAAVDLNKPGRFAVHEFDLPAPPILGNFWNEFTCEWQMVRERYFYPIQISELRRLPAIAFIHDLATDWDDYDEICRRIASYGYVIAVTHNPGYPSGTCIQCGGPGSSTYGFARATGFQFEAAQMIRGLTLGGSGTPLSDRIDLDNLFLVGHGYGGATTLLHTVFRPGLARGAIALMPLDPKAQSCLVPTYLTDTFPLVPTLNISAELDKDVEAHWPVAENPSEDLTRTGMFTHATIYGANHNFAIDDPFPADASARFCRQEQQDRVTGWMVAFLERHARGDLRQEGRLYGGEYSSSGDYAVFGRRDMLGTILIDDHQAGGPTTNSLGGMNSTIALVVDELDTHPAGFAFGRTISHRRFTLPTTPGASIWSAPLGMPVDASDLTHLTFRARQHTDSATIASSQPWQTTIASWNLTLTDDGGNSATIDLTGMMPIAAALPTCHIGLLPSTTLDRFHGFSMPLESFVALTPTLDLTTIRSISMSMSRHPTSGPAAHYLSVDDLRFD